MVSAPTPASVLSDETRSAIQSEIARFPEPRGALIAGLRLAQEERGYIDPEAAAEIAAIFSIRPIEVMEVVSFYNMLHSRPVGAHEVRVCTNLSCSLRGARSMLRGLEQHLGVKAGETTPDGRITLGHEECLGACAGAPMLRIDEVYHENLDLQQATALMDGLVSS